MEGLRAEVQALRQQLVAKNDELKAKSLLVERRDQEVQWWCSAFKSVFGHMQVRQGPSPPHSRQPRIARRCMTHQRAEHFALFHFRLTN